MQTTALYSFAWNHSSLKHRCRATTHWHAAPRRWPGPTCGDALGASKVTGDLQGLGIKNVSRIQSSLRKRYKIYVWTFGNWAIAAPKKPYPEKNDVARSPKKSKETIPHCRVSSHPSFDILQLQSQLKWDDHLPSVLGLAKGYLLVNLPESWSTFLSPL